MRSTKTLLARIAAALIAALAATACGDGGDTNPNADGDLLDNGKTSDAPSVASYPVTAEYAGLTWSITGITTETDDGGITLLADLEVTNNNPFGMKWDTRVVTLRTADDVALRPEGGSIEVDDGATAKETLRFETDTEPDDGDLSLMIAENDRIPEIVPFAGGAEAKPYPIEPTFEGAMKPLQALTGVGYSNSGITVITALGASIGVDAPGKRASLGTRFVAVEIRLEQQVARAGIYGDRFTLQTGDGQKLAPVDTEGLGGISGGSTQDATLLYEVPDNVSSLALVASTPPPGEGTLSSTPADSDQLPIIFDAPFPPCCGE